MQPKVRQYTEEEYLALDEAAPEGVRLEYFNGLVYHKGQLYDPALPDLARAMAGGTPQHVRISANAARAVGNQLIDCHVGTSDQQVHLDDGSYVYPDLVASCDPRFDGNRLLNPQLIVEVLSASTAEVDVGRKLQAYMQLASLREYWVVAQKEVRVVRYYRSDAGWITRLYADLDQTISSDLLGITVALAELYRGTF